MTDAILRRPPADNRLALQPARTYAVPGGPAAKNLADVDVARLAEIIRGGSDDGGAGDKR